MKHLVLLSLIITSLPHSVAAQTNPPSAGTEGKWEGTCTRGTQSVNASIFVDQAGARMNGKGVERFSKKGLAISFVVPGKFEKVFRGQFSPNTSTLAGSLIAEGKEAKCTMNRKISDPARICIRNPDQQEVWWKLDPGNPASPVRILGGSEDRGSGVVGGKLCWGRTTTEANSCVRSLPQSSYACG